MPRTHSAGVLWPDEGDGPWHIEFDYEISRLSGRAECVGAHVRYVGAEGECITRSLMREIPFARLIDRVLAQAVRSASARPDNLLDPFVDVVVKRNKIGRPPLYDAEHWREVARVYAQAWDERKLPTQAVRDRWRIQKSTAAKWVSRCRALGLLPPTTRGRAGGVKPKPKTRKRSTRKGKPKKTRSTRKGKN